MNNLGRGSENKKKDKDRVLTRETIGFVLVLFAALALVILITRSLIFGSVGSAISSFLLGVFGYCSYAVLAALIYAGVVLISGKRISARKKTVILCILEFVFFVCLVHTITCHAGGIDRGGSYGKYLSDCFAAGKNSFFSTTGGGVIIGLVVYPVARLTTYVGGYIIFSLLMVAGAYFIYTSKTAATAEKRRRKQEEEKMVAAASGDTSDLYNLNYAGAAPVLPQENASVASSTAQPSSQPVQYPAGGYAAPAAQQDPSRRLFAIGDEFDFKSKKELRQDRRAETAKREEQRPQQAQAPLSPYAQSRSVLYPENASQYKNNLIFDSNSYFNNPNRGIISRQQYSDNFRSSGASSFSEGHERSNRTEPPRAEQNPQSAAQPSQSYSAMYSDDAESNITYTNRPKKIVTDTTRPTDSARPDSPVSSYSADGGYYRKDVNTSFSAGEGFSSRRPVSSFTDRTEGAAQPSAPISGNPEQGGAGVSDTAGIRTNRESVRGSEVSDRGNVSRDGGVSDRGITSRSNELPDRGALSRGVDAARAEVSGTDVRGSSLGAQTESTQDRAAFGRAGGEEQPGETRVSGFVDRERTRPVSDENIQTGSEENAAHSEPARGRGRDEVRFMPPSDYEKEEEEKSELRPITDDFDTAVNLFDSDDDEEGAGDSSVPEASERIRESGRRETPASRTAAPTPVPAADHVDEIPKKKHIYARYNAPPATLLREYQSSYAADGEEIERNKETIVDTLYQLKIPSEVVSVTQGPTVTRYDIDIPGNIPTGRVLSCDKELAMRLHAKDGVNIQTNYENGSISIEVPNKQKATVGLKEMILSDKFVNSKPGALMFGLGKDIEGRSICGDITKMKHLLVAGSTGSGKSVCLNALIISLLYKYSPEEMRIILVDPKQVEFNIYDKLPHLMINEIIFEPSKVITVLNWAITEMERRYGLFKAKTKSGTLVREIDEYNAHLSDDEERLPKIVMIIDELADLMQAAKKDIEDRIQRLTQKSRAAGIHLVLATQRPSTDVITGIIKSNLPTRIAFKVVQEVDSRTILDSSGAEKLLGNGDMLYKMDTMTFPYRVQGAFLSSQEVQDVVGYIKEHNEAYFDESVSDFINNNGSGGAESGAGGGDDDSVEAVYIDALRYAVSIGQASISMIQRKCSVGYPKAGKIIEWMENMGYISAFDGAKARKVLLTQEEFESKYGDYGN